ncbi:hypothetical protein MSLAZ_2067 [Methanosarcina lacustris Z-7289]|uniref:DUF2795 domain-containing protein n=1 Tax=Methanosarcina lacustris Z-7289 TaxID=1434111 RepID=A0A0E3S8A9_9EURY|nr:DUF2795 domain-containing protein [Methanosarcina lacustris]AKB75328.1 hypothetical protein MSLAZ_2067 [Methanosarcina lacustris Z-7289]
METESKSGFLAELSMETQGVLAKIDFPVKRNDIIGQARKSRTTSDTLRELGMLPDKKYNSAENVAEELHIIYMGVPA